MEGSARGGSGEARRKRPLVPVLERVVRGKLHVEALAGVEDEEHTDRRGHQREGRRRFQGDLHLGVAERHEALTDGGRTIPKRDHEDVRQGEGQQGVGRQQMDAAPAVGDASGPESLRGEHEPRGDGHESRGRRKVPHPLHGSLRPAPVRAQVLPLVHEHRQEEGEADAGMDENRPLVRHREGQQGERQPAHRLEGEPSQGQGDEAATPFLFPQGSGCRVRRSILIFESAHSTLR